MGSGKGKTRRVLAATTDRQHGLLGRVIAEYEALGKQVYEDGVWQCQTGANLLTYMLTQAGIPAATQVGRYWHPDADSRNRTLGYEGDDADTHRDEHHYWTQIFDSLLDPNGEVRGEPRVQSIMETGTPDGGSGELAHFQGQNGVYEPFWEEANGDFWDPVMHETYDAMDCDPVKAAKYDSKLSEGLALLAAKEQQG